MHIPTASYKLVNHQHPQNLKDTERKSPNPWLPYIIGDCKGVEIFLDSKTGLLWCIVKFFNALFRGVGQVVFANNPWSGLIILLCLYWADAVVGAATTLSASTAIFTALIFKQKESDISNGLTTYCAVLVGSVTASLWTPFYGEELSFKIWGFIVLGSALSVLVNIALGNILASFSPNLPSFTFAFNIVTILMFTTLQPNAKATAKQDATRAAVRSMDEETSSGRLLKTLLKNSMADLTVVSPRLSGLHGNHDEGIVGVDIIGVLQGILLSMGQVYAVECLTGSIMMYMATLIYSPIVCIMSFVGASVASFFSLIFLDPPYDAVYQGLWGYNAILAAICIGAYFFIPSPLSFLVALADVVFAVFIQKALSLSFALPNLPVLTFPFVISSILFLEVTAKGDYLTRVKKFSYPEMHLHEFYEKKKSSEGQDGKPKARIITIEDDAAPLITAASAAGVEASAPPFESNPYVSQMQLQSFDAYGRPYIYPSLPETQHQHAPPYNYGHDHWNPYFMEMQQVRSRQQYRN